MDETLRARPVCKHETTYLNAFCLQHVGRNLWQIFFLPLAGDTFCGPCSRISARNSADIETSEYSRLNITVFFNLTRICSAIIRGLTIKFEL
jgi:protoporphyrinogen oxidase